MRYEIGCDLDYDIAEPSTLIFNVAAAPGEHQVVASENIQCNAGIEIEEYTTQVNKNRYIRINTGPCAMHLSYRASIDLSPGVPDQSRIFEVRPAEIPFDILPYVYSSRYCQSDRLLQMASIEFGGMMPGYGRVLAICDYINRNVTYRSGSSDSMTSACDTIIEREGVCRDFAHLGIALCRALNIPARFVTGYAYGLNPADFHAWFEAYLSNSWYAFDATRLVSQSDLIRVGVGRDAADVSFATIFGQVQMSNMQVYTNPVNFI